MKTPVFLALDEVIQIHDYQIKRFGGHPGIRDIGLLQSAIATPSLTFGGEYLHSDIYEMASAYLFHIGMKHPFIDGNKLTGVVAAMVFLQLNGIQINVAKCRIENLSRTVADGKMDKPAIARFFRENAVPLSE